ncbi:hypothetical protein EV1_000673 [Malus domestica]
MVESDSATDQRNLRRPRTRRKENSARTQRRPLRSASMTSRYTLCWVNELTRSPTAVEGGSGSYSDEAFGVIPHSIATSSSTLPQSFTLTTTTFWYSR